MDNNFQTFFQEEIQRRLAAQQGLPEIYLRPQASREDTDLAEARERIEEYIVTADTNVSWDDVIGNDRAKLALLEAIEHPRTHSHVYEYYGLTPPRGVLLYGAAGCGKTMFGKAVATAVGSELVSINANAIQSMWAGATQKRINAIFDYAELYAKRHGRPLVIFIDEADALLPPRDRARDWEAQNVATFLSRMDGLKTSSAFVLLATNRPDHIDEAILRDGRIDRKVRVERPDLTACSVILSNALRGAPLGDDFTVEEVVDYLLDPNRKIGEFYAGRANVPEAVKHTITLGNILSGALLVGVVNRAKSLAFQRDMKTGKTSGITLWDMLYAIDAIVEDNKGLSHETAMQEMVAKLNEAQP